MSGTSSCPKCGGPVSEAVELDGICPRCLMQAVVEVRATRTAPPTLVTRAEDPARIGPYEILELLGEGGMGVVYLARQEEPIRRDVALKVTKLGMDTGQVLSRFESERQALAILNHPNVAKVHDAGSTEQGRPYFVMEHVPGVPFTDYCDRQRLETRRRLELFLPVCEAIQHAHQKGIIHRDIKPSNVLVAEQDGRPVPKVIDFGVAKATGGDLADRTLHTELGVMIGTLDYMSPEQAGLTDHDIDTRTDIYSLGVLLYETLVGALPFDSEQLRSSGPDGIRQTIREVDPPRPSARLETLGEGSTDSAARRGTDLVTLRGELRGDLDWITMKALEKDRARRYRSPMELAADIERHLTDQPVLAGPPSTSYRMGKFVRRHRWGVGVSAVLVAALIVGVIGTTAGLVRARRAERRALLEAQTSERVTELLTDMLGATSPSRLGGLMVADLRERIVAAKVTAGAEPAEIDAVLSGFDAALVGVNTTDAALRVIDQEILGRVAEAVRAEGAEPRIAARMEHAIGWVYLQLGLLDAAEEHARLAFEMHRRELGPEHRRTLMSGSNLAVIYGKQNRLSEAEELHRQMLDTRRAVYGAEDRETLFSMNNLASVFVSQDRLDEAVELFTETLEIRRRVLEDEHPETLRSISNLAAAYIQSGHFDRAEPLQREAVEIQRRTLGPDAADTLRSLNNLAIVIVRQGRYDDAREIWSELLEIQLRTLGTEHLDTLRTMTNLAGVHQVGGRYQEAANAYLAVLEASRRLFGERHRATLLPLFNLACNAALRGEREAGLDWLRQAVENGYARPDRMTEDEDLTALHGPEFDRLVERAARNAAARGG